MAQQYRIDRRLVSLALVLAACGFFTGWNVRADVIPRFGALTVDIPWDTKAPQSMPIWVDCYCVTHGTVEPCAKAVTLTMRDEECEGSPGHPCGHQQARHNPHSPLDAKTWWAKAGFLTDLRDPTEKVQGTFGGVLPEDPLILELKYTAGQVTGRYDVTAEFSTLLPGHYFLTPVDSPPGDCAAHTSCTEALSIAVAFPGLVELPPPSLTVTDQTSGDSIQVPWVRCGKTGTGGTSPCTYGTDNAYNWPSHPTVHWAAPDMRNAAETLAWEWYEACSVVDEVGTPNGTELRVVEPHGIVYTDASLPLGGMLDVGANWQPASLSEPPAPGHRTHRTGVAVDISQLSVPPSGRCGPVPTDPASWLHTALHDRQLQLVRRAGLQFITQKLKDPNHVFLRGVRNW
ncbi:MAG: hypothetical protein EDX89_08505 [Acidobacteria bacterium]|nr:MAG: hypothetical protein EDX89_08505 [Acidobacteriota bacterium]